MSRQAAPNFIWNPWKWTAIGLAVVGATALITGVVVAHYVGNPNPNSDNAQLASIAPDAAQPQAAPPQAPPQVAPQPAAPAPQPPPRRAAAEREAPARYEPARPSVADIEECNHYASAAQDRTGDTVKDALVGGAAGAGLGAAGGAIAGGGRGAGKGAGIGALVGAAAGTLFGLNDSNQRDAQASIAYRECMRRRGYRE